MALGWMLEAVAVAGKAMEMEMEMGRTIITTTATAMGLEVVAVVVETGETARAGMELVRARERARGSTLIGNPLVIFVGNER